MAVRSSVEEAGVLSIGARQGQRGASTSLVVRIHPDPLRTTSGRFLDRYRNGRLSGLEGDEPMSATVLGALATAGLLGVTHALEPDHVAGISSLTGEYGDSRLSALAGACFSFGHVALVAAWLVVASALLGRTEFPAALDAVGTVGVGVVLGLLGAAMAVGGLRRFVRSGSHDHGDVSHSHPHVHLPLPGIGEYGHGDDHDDDRDHGVVPYLATGLVGALFTLSPPVSMIVFSSTLLSDYGGSVVGLAVLTYGVAITVTMSLLGAGAGTLFGLTRERSGRFYGIARAVAGVAVAALAASLLLDATGTLL